MFQKLPGQETSKFNNWPWKLQFNRKFLHFEVDKKEIKFVDELIKVSQKKKFFGMMWGKQVHVSNVVGNDTSSVANKRVINISLKHMNFHSSNIMEELVGIIDFDVTDTVYIASYSSKLVATMNLRHVLYSYVKMEDVYSLIAKAHQQGYMGSVNIVIPNTPEAKLWWQWWTNNFLYIWRSILKIKGCIQDLLGKS